MFGWMPKCFHAKICASPQIVALVLVEGQKATHLAKCYYELAKVLVKTIGMLMIVHANILASNQADS